MITKRTTLVLGAGASYAAGYPLGWQLTNQLCNFSNSAMWQLLATSHGAEKELFQFIQKFKASSSYSIDDFLGRHPRFQIIGKKAIAALLLNAPRDSTRPEQSSEERDDWYRYLLHKMTSDASWDELDLSNLSIITFNYDRSLEHFLLEALSASYGRPITIAKEKLKALKIIHVYGSIGNPTWDEPITETAIAAAANSIRVIPEDRHADDDRFEQARSLLNSAEAIGYLGFGFAKTNRDRLELGNVGNDRRVQGHGRPIVASCMGMTAAECAEVSAVIKPGLPIPAGELPAGFWKTNCYMTLRESLLLG